MLSSDGYKVLAEANRIRKVPVLAPRGRIFDREGRLLVDNYPSVSCYLLREQMKDREADLPLIAQGLHMTVEQIQATMQAIFAGAEVPVDSVEAGHYAG